MDPGKVTQEASAFRQSDPNGKGRERFASNDPDRNRWTGRKLRLLEGQVGKGR
jgi:hypothetical protein